jgi:hypothetical protein
MKSCGQKVHFKQQPLFLALETAAPLNMSMPHVSAGNHRATF